MTVQLVARDCQCALLVDDRYQGGINLTDKFLQTLEFSSLIGNISSNFFASSYLF